MIALDQLVPMNHHVRKIEAALDFSFIYKLVEDMYSEIGRPSIDFVTLIKFAFIQYTSGIRLVRKTVEEADDLRQHEDVKPIYAKRKETIERVFSDGKEKHGMRLTTLNGLNKLSMKEMLTFAAMNFEKLANWTWKVPQIV